MSGSDFLRSGVIEDVIKQRVWTINDILNADEVTESIVDTLINDMDNSTKWKIVKESTLSDDMSKHLRQELNSMVSFVLTSFLKTATVDFGGEKNEVEKNEEPVQRQVGTDENSVDETEKILTLKDRIRLDTKLMDENDKKKAGLI
jgi:hypothetical protein